MRYDAIVIGSGQSGPFLAAQLVAQGQKVALAEGYKIGGSCVNYGCIPTKTLIASARVAYLARHGARWGIHADKVIVNFEEVMARKRERVESANGGMTQWLESLDKLDVYYAFAGFEGTRDGVHQVRIGDQVHETERVFINTGAAARVPDVAGLHDVPHMTSEDLLNVDQLPEHLVIMGGGYIGLELGQAFHRFGSQVTIVEKGPRMVPREDEDVAQEIHRFLSEEGLDIRTGATPKAVRQNPDGSITLTVSTAEGEQDISGSHLLVAAGRHPNTPRLNLEAVGVATNQRGYINVDEHLRTNVPGIWALGDVNGRGAFTHTSYQDYEIVWDNLNGGHRKLDRNMAYALYIDPPLGRVGMSEQQARESGRKVLMAVKPMSSIGRALEQGETNGLMKFLVDAETEQILGATVLGFHGDDVIQAVSYFMATGASYQVMQHALPIHPTIAEFFPTMLGDLAPLS